MSESRGGSKFNAKETGQAIPSHRLDFTAGTVTPMTDDRIQYIANLMDDAGHPVSHDLIRAVLAASAAQMAETWELDLRSTMLEIAVAQIRYALESDELTPATRTTLTTARGALNRARAVVTDDERERIEAQKEVAGTRRCTNWQDSCHGDPEIDECVCERREVERLRLIGNLCRATGVDDASKVSSILGVVMTAQATPS